MFKDNFNIDKTPYKPFDPNKKQVVVNLSSGTTCNVTATTDMVAKENLNAYSWNEIKTISEGGIAPSVFNIGDTKLVTVNNQPHEVRIIGFDHDELPVSTNENPQYAGITFEFANLISDSDGNALATQWNDTNTIAGSNYNFLNGSIRQALNSSSTSGFLWAQKEATTWSSTYKGSVLSMLPTDLTDEIKPVKKYVSCYANGQWQDTLINDDKLFLLSPREMGSNTEYQETEEHTSTYDYYESETSTLIKTQTNKVRLSTEYYSLIGPSEGQIYQENVQNFAGCNEEDTYAGTYWLRSPFITDNESAWLVVDHYFNPRPSYYLAHSVAPAFCI